MSEFVTSLDQALDRLRRGESLAEIRPGDPAQAEMLDDLLTTALALELLRPVPLPLPADLAADRDRFLAELDQMAVPAVSAGPLVRLKGWIAQLSLPSLIPTFFPQEQRRMNALIVITLIVSLVAGSAGGVAAASENSLPGSGLYPVKLGLEQARLGLTTDPAQQASRWQERVQERAAEIEQMARQGQAIGEAELARLQTQVRLCLKALAGLPDPAMSGQLEQFRQMSQQQQQALEQAGVPAAAQIMNQAGQAAAEGLADPAAFRLRYGHLRPDEAPVQPTLVPGPSETVEPPATPAQTPVMRREQAGPLASPTCCTPTGDANRYGPQPDQPGPGQPGGNPDGQNTPTGDANRYGPQANQPGPGQPGGNPDGQNTPTGDAHKYGPQPDQPGSGQPGGNPTATCTPQPTGDAHQNGPSQPDGAPGDPGGNDNAANSGGSDDPGGSGDTGGSSDSAGSGDTGGSSDSGGSGDSGGSSDSGGSGDSGGSSDSGGSGDGGGSSDGGGSGGKK